MDAGAAPSTWTAAEYRQQLKSRAALRRSRPTGPDTKQPEKQSAESGANQSEKQQPHTTQPVKLALDEKPLGTRSPVTSAPPTPAPPAPEETATTTAARFVLSDGPDDSDTWGDENWTVLNDLWNAQYRKSAGEVKARQKRKDEKEAKAAADSTAFAAAAGGGRGAGGRGGWPLPSSVATPIMMVSSDGHGVMMLASSDAAIHQDHHHAQHHAQHHAHHHGATAAAAQQHNHYGPSFPMMLPFGFPDPALRAGLFGGPSARAVRVGTAARAPRPSAATAAAAAQPPLDDWSAMMTTMTDFTSVLERAFGDLGFVGSPVGPRPHPAAAPSVPSMAPPTLASIASALSAAAAASSGAPAGSGRGGGGGGGVHGRNGVAAASVASSAAAAAADDLLQFSFLDNLRHGSDNKAKPDADVRKRALIQNCRVLKTDDELKAVGVTDRKCPNADCPTDDAKNPMLTFKCCKNNQAMCYECVSAWFEAHLTCPFCRRDLQNTTTIANANTAHVPSSVTAYPVPTPTTSAATTTSAAPTAVTATPRFRPLLAYRNNHSGAIGTGRGFGRGSGGVGGPVGNRGATGRGHSLHFS